MEPLFFSFLISRGSKYAHYYLLQAKVQISGGHFVKIFQQYSLEVATFLKEMGGLEYRK